MKNIHKFVLVIIVLLLSISLFAQGKIMYNVSVVGAVNNPGVYMFPPTNRVSEAIKLANTFLDTLNVPVHAASNASKRNITLKRNDEILKLDLLRFLILGEEDSNPYLEDGDIIVVPAIHKHILIIGAVNKPGSYELIDGDRVSDIIALAMGLRDDVRLPKAEVVRFVDEHDSTKTIEVNLERIIKNPECGDNFFLENDDRIFIKAIPEYHKRKELKVFVSGAIKNAGEFDLTEGYRLYDAIASAGGLRDDAYLDKAEVVRFVDEHDSTKTIEVNLERIIKNPECDDNFFLENDDRIFIYSIPKYHEDKLITIHGEVQFPGYYSIEETKATLLEILEKCGGPTSQADLQNAFLQRKSKVDALDMEFERLKKMLVEDMTVLEYEYFKTKSRELRGKFAIDFENLWNSKDKSSDIVLKNNDFIFIPDKSTTINVSGQVKNPGLINFVPGKNYLYYIEQAGGFAWNARKSKIRLIKSNTGEWLKPKKDTIVEVKDMIFIPEKLDVDYWKLTKDIMTISAQIATTIIVIQSITTN